MSSIDERVAYLAHERSNLTEDRVTAYASPEDVHTMSAPSNTKPFLAALGITEVFWSLAGVGIMLISQPLDQALHYWWVFQIACLAIGAVSVAATWLVIAGEP